MREDLCRYHAIHQSTKAPHPNDSHRALRRKLVDTLGQSQSISETWEAYSALLHVPCPDRQHAGLPNIPFLHLHRLSRLLARSRPRTRSLFLRLLSVLRTIHDSGGTVHLDEWNALVHLAGRGWRKTRLEDFRVAMDVYHDMVTCKAPGTTLMGNGERPSKGVTIQENSVKPNIVTYTTLLAIAARTSHAPALQHVNSLIKSSGIAPNRITHLALLQYSVRTRQLSGVHATLVKMKEQGFELGLDGLNACLDAFGRNDCLDIVSMIYRVLRHNVQPENENGNDIRAIAEHLANTHAVVIPAHLVPDAITYVTMVQVLAYRGHLTQALNVFVDMLSSIESNTARHEDEMNDDVAKSSPIFPAFRAIFLGFTRYGKTTLRDRTRSHTPTTTTIQPDADDSAWILENLDALFQGFLALPGIDKPSRATLYWILIAFQKTSGSDVKKLREVWLQLEERFQGPWTGPDHRLERLRRRIFAGHIHLSR